MLFSYSCFS